MIYDLAHYSLTMITVHIIIMNHVSYRWPQRYSSADTSARLSTDSQRIADRWTTDIWSCIFLVVSFLFVSCFSKLSLCAHKKKHKQDAYFEVDVVMRKLAYFDILRKTGQDDFYHWPSLSETKKVSFQLLLY